MSSELIKTKFPGIYYRQDANTKVKTYIARIKLNGIINTEQIVGYSNDAIRTNPSIAFEKRTELINKLKNGESIKVKENPTLNGYFEEFYTKKENQNIISTDKIYIYKKFYKKHFSDALKRKRIKQIKKDDIQSVIDAMLKKEYAPSYILTLKSCFNPLAKEALEEGIITKNFMLGLKYPEFDKNRYFTLSKEKAKALYKEILEIPDNQYRAMFLFLLRGRRANEVLTLEWKNINFDEMKYTILAGNSKIKRTLTFPLDEELVLALKCLNIKEEGLVFVSPVTGKKFYEFPKRLWKSIKEKLDIEDMKIHDFRHLLGFTLVNSGMPLEYISKALGHSKITTTQMYSNQKEQMAKQAVDSYLDMLK
jgi:integrase